MPPVNAIKEFIVRFLLFCIATSMKMHMYPLAKFWGYRRFEPQPDSIMVTCAAVCTNQGRSAGPPEANLGARRCKRLRGAPQASADPPAGPHCR